MSQSITIPANPVEFRIKILNFLDQFSDAVLLDSNTAFQNPEMPISTHFDFIAGAGVAEEISTENASLEQLQHFINRQQDQGNRVFGFISYDIKNQIEKLTSTNSDYIGFPTLHFFVPLHTFEAKDNALTITSKTADALSVWQQVLADKIKEPVATSIAISYIQNRESYFESLNKILSHIRYGDIYEMNYCHEVKLKAESFNPVEVYKKLSSISPNPFSAYYRTKQYHLICGSPERFLVKRGMTVTSQPVKGTSARSDDTTIDEQSKEFLRTSEKERSENVMIVDLVRNDLSAIAQRGSVKVDELFGVYSFKRAHQMISTVSCNAKPEVNFTEIIRSTFPMGSMTGAPKVSAMKLIEKYETFRRGIFSGTVGYINADGDFDFNVVIRSILYNQKTGNVSIAAGGAITASSDPEKEYQETILKIAPQLAAVGLNTETLLQFKPALNHA